MPPDVRNTNRHAHAFPLVDRLDYFLRSRASKVVVLALVANTMVAQLLYNSAGQLVLGNAFVVGYLLISAVCSTFAFALFEVSTIFQLHDLMALDASIKAGHRRGEADQARVRRAGGLLADQLPLGALLPGSRLAQRERACHGLPARQPAGAVELVVLQPACRSLHRGAVPGGHLRRTAQDRQGGDLGDAARAGTAGVGALADAEGGPDRADGPRWPAAWRSGRGARQPRRRRSASP